LQIELEIREITEWNTGDLNSMSSLLIAVVEDGASIGFLPPLSEQNSLDYWKDVLAPDVRLWVAIGGDSAGANIAAAVTLMVRIDGQLKLCAQLLIYPVTSCRFETNSYDEFASGYLLTRDAMEWFRGHYLSKPEDADDPLASPLLSDDLSGLPQAYIVTAECDPVRDDGEKYAKRLQEAGIPVLLRRYDGMIHDFMSFADPPWELNEAVQAIDDTANAMKQLFHMGGDLS
jgi:acetyl esterase